MNLFCDLPDDTRMAYRRAAEQAGCQIEGYSGDCIQLALPDNWFKCFFDVEDELKAAGLILVASSPHYFPLGSDVGTTPESLRHDGNYPGSKGFWLFARFRPKEFAVMGQESQP